MFIKLTKGNIYIQHESERMKSKASSTRQLERHVIHNIICFSLVRAMPSFRNVGIGDS